MLTLPGNYKIEVKQGQTLYKVWTWTAGGVAVNLTGYLGAKMMVRGVNGNLLLTCNLGAEITLGGIAGTVTLNVADDVILSLPVGDHKYDIRLTNSAGQDFYFLEGDCSIDVSYTS